jgi:2-polyprenyl-3-methyl-5-hydroxy-6-metoxy-1,4-benzoquinol methylase
MQVITTLEELDEKLRECDAALKVSDAAMRDVFATFRMDLSTRVPADPFSPAYQDFQMSLYQRLSGREYTPANEKTKFDTAAADQRPFPYNTGSCRTTGFFTMAVGYLLFCLDLQPGARVLEFGPGWGNTTMAMAMTGLDVTAVDIEPDFCDLLRLRAQRHGVDVKVVNADFMWAEQVTEPYDAVVFFECFHHCSDHRRLLAAMDRALKPEGRIYFASEPITRDFPVPWGLRTDGESLWAIRTNGWMELGFNETYFREALRRAGWTVERHAMPDIGWAAVWEARQAAPTQEGASGPYAPVTPTPAAPFHAEPGFSGEAELRRQLDSVYRSTSWRVTAPLRAAGRLLKGRHTGPDL